MRRGGFFKEAEVANRSTQIVRTSIVGIVANIALAAFKAVVGMLDSLGVDPESIMYDNFGG